MTTKVENATKKEQTIFHHVGNKLKTEDRDVNIIAKFEEPLVVVLGNVLSNEECDELIRLSKEKVTRSKIGTNHEINEIRTSSSTFLPSDENKMLIRIQKRLSCMMNIPIEHGEDLQILQYAPGQEYKAHFDFFSSAKNNRISTLVMYLNDVEEGGETFFPELHFSVYPQKGMAVYFEYFYNDQHINERTIHGGAPVIKGEKWVATQWMRKQRLF